MNPFDWRSVVLAKHAQHVVLIHFPIALFIAAVALDIIGQWSRNRSLLQAAYFMLRDGVEYRDLGVDHFDRRDKTKAIGRLLRRLGDLGCQVEIKAVAA